MTHAFYYLYGVTFPEALWLKIINRQLSMQEILQITDIDQRTQAIKYAKEGLREILEEVYSCEVLSDKLDKKGEREMLKEITKQCVHCRDEVICKLHEESCNGYIPDCPEYEEGTDNFYKDEKFIKFTSKLSWEDKQLFIEIVGDAIQYGIACLGKKLKEPKKCQEKK